tara:strand:+ start:683 stop:892 length:210 start_codon:yes stop_codon:yes gene_type:complete
MTKIADNGVVRDMTPKEEAQLTADREADIAAKTASDNAKAENDALKASAKAKLIAGEALTDAEADTVVI